MNQSEIQKAQRVIYLVTGYRKGSISESESAELDAWLNLSLGNQDLFNELNSADQKEKALDIMNAYAVNESFENLKTRIAKEDQFVEKRKRYSWMAAAAAILILVSIGGYFYTSINREHIMMDGLAVAKDVAPGSNKATLTLADGRTVELSGDKQSVIIKADELTYNDGTKIISEGKSRNQYAVLTTPKGGQYQIILSDGTKIWLNAASTLKYPAEFEGSERVVQLSGEAYFEVAKVHASSGRRMSFIVKTETQQVEVLGTHFNINNYPDESFAKTTLLEGSVRVSAASAITEHQLLKPNQQSIIAKDSEFIKIIKVDPTAVIDWKNGDFIFDTDVKTIMRQISRWYNVEIVYQGNITEEELVGRISRSKHLTEVLKVLQETNKVHFKLEDTVSPGVEKRVIVMP
ncbi:FecR family protein [Pedobacter hiemivivus]|uniref:FecR family protein n=1 Tax=Pedobacter hiemivivus TaxID=2530454 RepID=A0A4R0NE11_9SPHI|nr:FecR family protein [Pedobacter hiemivivus]TCC98659.1 FecR family protein [Pedobacter hiemivivus]TKC65308.1 FecR family protein [Pedobacter hiemivivus]